MPLVKNAIVIVPLILGSPWVMAQSVSTGAPQAPTSFVDRLSSDENVGGLKRSPAVHLRQSGGDASIHSLSLRGGTAKEVGLTLEGVPLNSVSSGVYDLGLINPYGLDDIKVIRGGYSPLSTSPSGQIVLRLPQEPVHPRFTLGYGSFNHLFLGAQLPFATITMDRSDNDWRDFNAHSRVNVRLWKQTSTSQIWTQLLYNNVQSPGPTDALYLTETETLRPTLAVQKRWGTLEAQSFLSFQNQRVIGVQTNRSFDGGISLQTRRTLSSQLSTEVQIQQRFEQLLSNRFDSELRSTTSLGNSWLWSPTPRLLVHPQWRVEFVSDLDQKFSIHPGIGLRWSATDRLQILSNASFIQRAPNFYEMYYEFPDYWLSNRTLRRETAWQGDIGYEWTPHPRLRLQQAVFGDRKIDLLETVDLTPMLSQTQNQARSSTIGVENHMVWSMTDRIHWDVAYTYLMTRVDSDGGRSQYYQPRHKLFFIPEYSPVSAVRISLPLTYRSSVLDPSGDRSPDQWDLGLDLKSEAIVDRLPLELSLKLRNLLSRRREEVLNYPLPDTPTFSISASTVF